MNERPEDTTVTRERLKRSLRDVAGQFVVDNLWKILCVVAGFFAGGAVAYVGIWTQISDAKHAATDAKETAQRVESAVSQLVTKRELDTANDRIAALEELYATAKKEAGTPPSRHPRKVR